jgi:glutamine amidotransferase PdxT
MESYTAEAIFIRAPQIRHTSTDCIVAASFEEVPVIVIQKNMVACSFHPELSNDTRFHKWFLTQRECSGIGEGQDPAACL